MALSERDRKALVRGGVALGAILLYIFVIEPAVTGYLSLTDRHDTFAAQVAMSRRENQKIEHLAREVIEWEAAAGPLRPPKPYSEQITDVSGALSTAAKESGVKVNNTSWSDAMPFPPDASLERTLVTIDAEAEWEKTFKFIAGLYRIPGVLSVERLDLSGDEKQGKNLKLTLAVSVLVEAAPQEGL